MNIDQAIETLEEILSFIEPADPPEARDALELSIEAMKKVKRAREGDPAYDGELLPGEKDE